MKPLSLALVALLVAAIVPMSMPTAEAQIAPFKVCHIVTFTYIDGEKNILNDCENFRPLIVTDAFSGKRIADIRADLLVQGLSASDTVHVAASTVLVSAVTRTGDVANVPTTQLINDYNFHRSGNDWLIHRADISASTLETVIGLNTVPFTSTIRFYTGLVALDATVNGVRSTWLADPTTNLYTVTVDSDGASGGGGGGGGGGGVAPTGEIYSRIIVWTTDGGNFVFLNNQLTALNLAIPGTPPPGETGSNLIARVDYVLRMFLDVDGYVSKNSQLTYDCLGSPTCLFYTVKVGQQNVPFSEDRTIQRIAATGENVALYQLLKLSIPGSTLEPLIVNPLASEGDTNYYTGTMNINRGPASVTLRDSALNEWTFGIPSEQIAIDFLRSTVTGQLPECELIAGLNFCQILDLSTVQGQAVLAIAVIAIILVVALIVVARRKK